MDSGFEIVICTHTEPDLVNHATRAYGRRGRVAELLEEAGGVFHKGVGVDIRPHQYLWGGFRNIAFLSVRMVRPIVSISSG